MNSFISEGNKAYSISDAVNDPLINTVTFTTILEYQPCNTLVTANIAMKMYEVEVWL